MSVPDAKQDGNGSNDSASANKGLRLTVSGATIEDAEAVLKGCFPRERKPVSDSAEITEAERQQAAVSLKAQRSEL